MKMLLTLALPLLATFSPMAMLTAQAREGAQSVSLQVGTWHFRESAGTFQVKAKGSIQQCDFLKRQRDLITFKQCPYQVKVSIKKLGPQIREHYQVKGVPANKQVRLTLSYAKEAQEIFYGAGTQYTHLSLNDRITEFLTQEQGNGRGRQPLTFFQSIFARGLSGTETTTYASSPIITSSLLRAFVVDSYSYGFVDLTQDKTLHLAFHSDDLTVYRYRQASWPKLLEKVTEHTGRMRELPTWIQEGAIVGLMGGKKKVVKVINSLKKEGAAVAGVWTQDWVGRRDTFLGPRLLWDWRLHRKEYPDLSFASDVASLGYFNPFVSPLPKGARSPSFYDEALKRGYLIKVAGQVYASKQGGFEGHLVDLFNPQAYQWLKNHMKKAIKQHQIKGWMADFGEVLPFDAQTTGTKPPLKTRDQHHRYVEQWIKLNREIVDELGPKQLTFFNRSSHLKVPGLSTLYWLGDQTSTWDKNDGLHSSLIGLITSGLSGKTLNHSDIGGYVSFCLRLLMCFKRDQELLHRWMELNAFTAVFRSHPGLKPTLAEQVYSSAQNRRAFAYWSQVYKALKPYKAPYIKLAARKGTPLIRPMFFSFAHEPETHLIDDQFMLGEHLLIAPILKPQATTRQVYLPRGTWYRLWNDQKVVSTGQYYPLKGPRGKPPIYYREGFPKQVKERIKKLSL